VHDFSAGKILVHEVRILSACGVLRVWQDS
jgi:hypothetical protein